MNYQDFLMGAKWIQHLYLCHNKRTIVFESVAAYLISSSGIKFTKLQSIEESRMTCGIRYL